MATKFNPVQLTPAAEKVVAEELKTIAPPPKRGSKGLKMVGSLSLSTYEPDFEKVKKCLWPKAE